MITKEQEKMIRALVDSKYYDVEKMVRYLSMHDVVGNEIFQYCDIRAEDRDYSTYCQDLDSEDGYTPLPVGRFIQRIPFYFYTGHLSARSVSRMGNLGYVLSACSQGILDGKIDLETVYGALEFMYYELKLPLVKIFSYWIEQGNTVSSKYFLQWNHYLHLCKDLGSTDYYPERFITAYNIMLEACGLEPIIYEVEEYFAGEYYRRDGKRLCLEGCFPCDENGKPIMKWIGIMAPKAKGFSCDCKKSRSGSLWIDLAPDTVVHLLNVYNDKDEDGYWYQVYAGPLTMEFDHTFLKDKRKQLKMTQQEVAEAVGANVRTYQKWENGETTPDGHYLIRLLNWLDIPDIQLAIRYNGLE